MTLIADSRIVAHAASADRLAGYLHDGSHVDPGRRESPASALPGYQPWLGFDVVRYHAWPDNVPFPMAISRLQSTSISSSTSCA